MTEAEKKTAEAAELLQKLEKRAARADAIIALDRDSREYLDSLDDAGKDSFLSKSTGERGELVKAKAEGNAVVYTSADGEQFRASDDPRLVAMAKRGDADRKAAKDAEEGRQTEMLKRRVAKFDKVKGTEDAKVKILKALDVLDEPTKKVAYEILESANEMAKNSYEEIGTTDPEGDVTDEDHPEMKIEKMAKRLVKEKGLPYFKAYEEVTNLHPELVKAALVGDRDYDDEDDNDGDDD